MSREVNDLIRQQAGPAAADGQPLAFVCECGAEDCYLPVWLSAADYDALAGDESWRPVAGSHLLEDAPAIAC